MMFQWKWAPAVNMILLLILMTFGGFIISRNNVLLSISHEILSFEVDLEIAADGTQIVNSTTTVKRDVPLDCRLSVDRIIINMQGDVVVSAIVPGTAKDRGVSVVTRRWALPQKLVPGCYRIISRATTDCGLRSLIRSSPEREFCIPAI